MHIEAKVCDLRAALQRMGGKVQLLKHVIELYQQDAPQVVQRLQAAIAAGNPFAVQLAAHSLKGLVVTFGGDASAQAALHVEQAASEGDLKQASEGVRELERQLTRLNDALAAELQRL